MVKVNSVKWVGAFVISCMAWIFSAAATAAPTIPYPVNFENEVIIVNANDPVIVRANGETIVEKTVAGVAVGVVFPNFRTFSTVTSRGDLVLALDTFDKFMVRIGNSVETVASTTTGAYNRATDGICGNEMVRAPRQLVTGEFVIVSFLLNDQQGAFGSDWEDGCDLYWGNDGTCGGPVCEVSGWSPDGVPVTRFHGSCQPHTRPSGWYIPDYFITCDCVAPAAALPGQGSN